MESYQEKWKQSMVKNLFDGKKKFINLFKKLQLGENQNS